MLAKVQKTRMSYVLFAFLCLSVFFIGSTIVTKYLKKDDNYKENFKESVEVFNYENNYSASKEDLILRVLRISNSSLSLFIKEELEENKDFIDIDMLKEKIIESLNIKTYVKFQFPAMFTYLKESEEVFKKDKIKTSTIDTKNPEILEDLIFVEDIEESEEGEFLEESSFEGENVNAEGIPKAEGIKTLKVNREKPYVLIYHTHGTEAYMPIKENNYHITERKYNVLTIGDILTEKLEKGGHGVVHIDTYHDIPSYNKSYTRSLNTVTNALKKDENLKVVFDIHRDGVPDDANYKDKAISESKIVIDGKNVATFSIVIGPNSPNVEEVMKFAKYIKIVSDKMYPGLCKGIIIKPTGKFNQFVTDYYALIEIGMNFNTIDEAKESAKLVGNILSIVIEEIQK